MAQATAARLASIVQSSHDAVIGETLDHVITSWNPGAERLYGYTAGEMIGRHIEVLIPDWRRDHFLALRRAIAQGEQVRHDRTERVRKDGTTVPVSLTASPIADHSRDHRGDVHDLPGSQQ